jgi:hypothetical protein
MTTLDIDSLEAAFSNTTQHIQTRIQTTSRTESVDSVGGRWFMLADGEKSISSWLAMYVVRSQDNEYIFQ